MFSLGSSNRYHLILSATDMRKSFDSLSGLIGKDLSKEPREDVFIFINKRRDRMKILRWNGSGYVLYYKRLEEGTYELPAYDQPDIYLRLSYAELVMIVDGISILNTKKRRRYLSKNNV